MAQGTSESMVKISASVVRKLRVPLPALDDQAHLLSAIGSVTRLLESEVAELTKLRRLKQGLLDDLLSGRVAVSAMA
ncbi:hypothetical protein ABZT04_19515 [Streptomyces sp. NPDC005492]|uniref:hypothetical protein n=1 Tax=Streptomyces sp. NPDC005492 TaxID=3156883 RepID=UPI0033B9B6B0